MGLNIFVDSKFYKTLEKKDPNFLGSFFYIIIGIYPIPINSTSNIRVAFGGITPPAPALP